VTPAPDNDLIDSSEFPVAEPPEELRGELAGVDLRGRDLRRLDFRGRDLSGLHLEGADLTGADLRDTGLSSANLSGACLVGARLEGADLIGADLTRADLRGAILEGATLERAVLRDTTLARARARNSAWTEAEAEQGDWTGLDLQGSQLHRVRFSDLDLRSARLAGVRIDDSDWSRVRLSGASAAGLHVTDTSFEDVETRRADLTGAELRFANFDRVDLEDADLSGVVFESVAFKEPVFVGVKATDAEFLRCAGLTLDSLDRLQQAGARVNLPLLVRAWRGLGGIPGGRIAFILLLVVAVGLGVQRVVGRLPGQDDGGAGELEELIAASDDATRMRWQELQRAYEDEATRFDALRGLSDVLEQLGLHDQAEERLHEAIGLARLDPARPVTGAEMALGDYLLRSGRPDEAYDVALRIIEEAPSPDEAVFGHLLLARALVVSGNNRSALDELGQVTAFFGAQPAAPVALRLQTAQLLEELGEASAAFAALQGIPDSVPADRRAEAELVRAEMMLRAGDVSQAVATWDLVIDRYPDQPLVVGRARDGRAAALSGGPDPETEGRQLEALAEADDPELAVQGELGLARLAMRMENRPAAERRYKRAIDRFPDRPGLTLPAVRELARLYLASGETAEATVLLEQALGRLVGSDQVVVVREDLAGIWQENGDYARARRPLEASLREFGDDPEVVARSQLALAGIADLAGEVDDALVLYRAVAAGEVDPSMTAAALFGEATLQRRVGRIDEALPLMGRALELLPASDPMRGAVAVERAETLVELGLSSPEDLEEMLAEARSAGIEQAQPVAYGELLILMARELLKVDRPDDALALFQRVDGSPGATEDPSLKRSALEGQVAALVALGRNDQADELLGRSDVSGMSNGEAEENCDARMSLARGKAGTGDVTGATADFAALLQVCRSPRFLVQNLPVLADAMVAGGQRPRTRELLAGLLGEELPPVGRQAVQLELGRLGSVDELRGAMVGPDRALASLATIEFGQYLEAAGRLAEAEPLWVQVAQDEASEPVPRSLALLGLARLEVARGNLLGARGYLEEVVLIRAEQWIVEEAETRLGEIRSR
jgi:uncharacterized protein YjbI with pentapeptide repeats/tetratricopeptide (TPR) repeat protein